MKKMNCIEQAFSWNCEVTYTTELTVDDHIDFHRMCESRPSEHTPFVSTRVDYLGRLLSVPGSAILVLIILVWIWRKGRLDALLDNPVMLVVLVLGALLMPVLIYWLYQVIRLLVRTPTVANVDAIDDGALRNGLELGPVEFEALPEWFRVTLALEDTQYHWSAFQEIQETDRHLFLMFDAEKGIILPKRSFADDQEAHNFKSMIQIKIAVA